MPGRVVRLVISGFKADRLIVMNNDRETKSGGYRLYSRRKNPKDGQAEESGHV